MLSTENWNNPQPEKTKLSRICQPIDYTERGNWGPYCKICPEVAHHFFIVLPFSAYSTGKAGIPLQAFSDTKIHNPATKISRTGYYAWQFHTILMTGTRARNSDTLKVHEKGYSWSPSEYYYCHWDIQWQNRKLGFEPVVCLQNPV